MNDENESVSPVDVETVSDENGVTVNVILPQQQMEAGVSDSFDSEDVSSDESGNTPITVYAVDDSESEEGTLPHMVRQIFGEYHPRTQTVTQIVDGVAYESTQVVEGVSGLDWYWLSGVLGFTIVLLGFFSLLRIAVKR